MKKKYGILYNNLFQPYMQMFYQSEFCFLLKVGENIFFFLKPPVSKKINYMNSLVEPIFLLKLEF